MYQYIWNFTLCVVQSEFLLLYKYHPRFFLFSSTFYKFDFKVWNKRSFFNLFPLHSSPNHAFFFFVSPSFSTFYFDEILRTFLHSICSQPPSYSFWVFALCSTAPFYHSLSSPRFQTFHLKRLSEDALIRFPDHVYGIYQLPPADTFTCIPDRHPFPATVGATNPPTPGRNSLSPVYNP